MTNELQIFLFGVVMFQADELNELATEVAHRLSVGNHRLVLAESCTCGLVATVLGGVPGISEVFCGSAVTYREATKTGWLNVSPETLAEETAVSESVARQMAEGVLYQTSEATFAASITGHLGPNAPENQDGLVFVGCATRKGKECVSVVHSFQLRAEGRLPRRSEAAKHVLELVASQLNSNHKESP